MNSDCERGFSDINNTARHDPRLPPYVCVFHTRIIMFVEVEFMDELLYWITLKFNSVPDNVATECNVMMEVLILKDIVIQ